MAHGLDAFRTSFAPASCLALFVSSSETEGAPSSLTGSRRSRPLCFDQSRNPAEAKVHGLFDGVSAPRVFSQITDLVASVALCAHVVFDVLIPDSVLGLARSRYSLLDVK